MKKIPRRYVTVKQLQRRGACLGQIEEFKRLFGDRTRVTELAARAAAEVFNWDWAYDRLLTQPQKGVYSREAKRAEQAFEQQVNAAREYKAARQRSILDRYVKRYLDGLSPAYPHFDLDASVRDSDTTVERARRTRQQGLALAFVHAYLSPRKR